MITEDDTSNRGMRGPRQVANEEAVATQMESHAHPKAMLVLMH